MPRRGERGQRSTGGRRDARSRIGLRVIGAVEPDVGSVDVPVVSPDSLGLESVVEAAEGAEIIGRGVPAALRVVMVERDDVVEVGLLGRRLATGEDTGAVAALA